MCKPVISYYAVSRSPYDHEDGDVPDIDFALEVFDNSNWRDMPTIDDPFWPDPNQTIDLRSYEEIEWDRQMDRYIDEPDYSLIDLIFAAAMLRRRAEHDNSQPRPPTRRRLNFDSDSD